MKRFLDKRILVTGAASGIGRATAFRLLQEGARVVLLDRNAEALEQVLQHLQTETAFGTAARGIAADVLNAPKMQEAFQQAVETWGGLDVLVNNAGGSTIDHFDDLTPETWREEVELNLNAQFDLTFQALPELIQTRGNIVLVSSVNAVTGLGNPAYSAAKAGLISMAQNVAVRYGAQGLRCNVVLPGTIETPIHRYRYEAHPEHFQKLISWYPAGRIGQPEDVAAAIAFLAAEEASFINGAVLPVDGGLTAGSSRMIQDLTHS
ncbi:MAG: SDR family NAD(P)-dependent oxidoreductase [bacterium]|jgi:meso-butanediol dehydrogenase/(S,S)-butanediol dehydrogenase/diacetyl reductase